MSNIRLSANLFLEVNELNRYTKFIRDDGYKKIIQCLIKNFGIVSDSENEYFKTSVKTDTNDTIIVNPGIAVDSNLNIIVNNEKLELSVSYSDVAQWVVISYATSNDEEGTVKISSQGVLSGENTNFLSVLRGQPNYPTKVKFTSNNNTSEYEVVDVTSDTNATLSGSFVEESGLKYQVIGTFTPGFQPEEDDKTIYEYDSCDVSIIESENAPDLLENQFIIAKISYENNVLSVDDERSRNILNSVYNYVDSIDNPFVALRRVSLENNNTIDIQFEYGYKINSFKVTKTSTNNIFNIISGSSRYIGNGIIPDNIFKNWILLNRKNMISATIDSNVNNSLYISLLNSNLITNENDDFVIIPKLGNIEVVLSVSGSDYNDNDVNYVFNYSMVNQSSRINIPVKYLDTKVELKYRIFDSSNTTEFIDFSNSYFTNVDNEEEILSSSKFEIYIEEPEVVERNYS
jgi:hypothetical protein